MEKPTQEKVTIGGPAGSLEALLSYTGDIKSHIAVVCHPHPLHGGSMNNKVVHYTAKSFNEVGVPALKFNFRGVGASEGVFDHTVGEADDLEACARWIAARYPHRQLLLAGFSFGSYIVAKMAADLAVAGLITIAPAVNLYDYENIDQPGCPWLVIQGGEDEIVPPQRVRQWVKSTTRVSRLVWMPGASHFFHGHLPDLSNAIKKWLSGDLDLG